MNPLRLQIHLGERDATVRVTGALRDTSVTRFVDAIMRLIRPRIYRRVIVDMGDVSSCDAAAVLALSELADAAVEAGGAVMLVDPCPAVARGLSKLIQDPS